MKVRDKMFKTNLLNKLSDAIPADLKEKVTEGVKQQFSGQTADIKNSAMAKLGLATPVSGPTSEAAATPSGEVAQDQADETSDPKVNESE
jgi:hypothetical protein